MKNSNKDADDKVVDKEELPYEKACIGMNIKGETIFTYGFINNLTEREKILRKNGYFIEEQEARELWRKAAQADEDRAYWFERNHQVESENWDLRKDNERHILKITKLRTPMEKVLISKLKEENQRLKEKLENRTNLLNESNDENDILRKALDIYGDEKNWDNNKYKGQGNNKPWLIAQEALKEEDE